ncbi:MAG: hypothetical protein MMC33_001427 [Icmadophila ericetorum]|nr:hypothetical protein [Icmadophila ericetorum]
MSTLSTTVESIERFSASVRPATPPILPSRTSSLRSSSGHRSSGSCITRTKTEERKLLDVSRSQGATDRTPSPKPADSHSVRKRRKRMTLSWLQESISITQLPPRAHEQTDRSSTKANDALSVPESSSILRDMEEKENNRLVDLLGHQQLSDKVSANSCGKASINSKPPKKSRRGDSIIAISTEEEEEDEQAKKRVWDRVRAALRIEVVEDDLLLDNGSKSQKSTPCNVAPLLPPPPAWKHSASNFFPSYAFGLPQEDVIAWVMEDRTERMCAAARTAAHHRMN